MMEIRLLTANDAEAWWHLRLQALQNDPSSFADSAEEHLSTTVDAARARLDAGKPESNFVLGTFEDGGLAATTGFHRRQNIKEHHKGHVWGVYVRPESRGKGVARALMQEVIRRARLMPGLEQITLVVSTHIAARQLYLSLGFQSYGIEPRSLKIGDDYVDDELMVLRL